MGRAIMGGDFRAIRSVEVTVTDPGKTAALLELVGLFAGTQVFRPEGYDPDAPLPEGAIDLSIPDSQEPAEQPLEDGSENSPISLPEAADEAPAQPEPVEEPPAPEPVAEKDDYDPIAAVLGN